MKKILIWLLVIFVLFISAILVLRAYGFIFLFSSNEGCYVITSDKHWINIINNKTAFDTNDNKTLPVSKLRFRKAKIIGCTSARI